MTHEAATLEINTRRITGADTTAVRLVRGCVRRLGGPRARARLGQHGRDGPGATPGGACAGGGDGRAVDGRVAAAADGPAGHRLLDRRGDLGRDRLARVGPDPGRAAPGRLAAVVLRAAAR